MTVDMMSVLKRHVFDVAELEPGSVGLALSYAMTLTGMFQWGVRQSAEIENMVRLYTQAKCLYVTGSVLLNTVIYDMKCDISHLQNNDKYHTQSSY